MRIRDLLPDSSPVKGYLNANENVASLTTGACKESAIEHLRSKHPSTPVQRQTIVNVIRSQYERSGLPVPRNLEKLMKPGTRTVTTGHQLVIGTGPIFSIYKALTAVALAERLSDQWGETVLPIFWMASEDHDFEEIRALTVAGGGRVNWDGPADMQGGDWPVGRMSVEGLPDVLKDWASAAGLPNKWTELLLNSTQGTLADSFRRWMHLALGEVPIILIDADVPELKTFFASMMNRELEGDGIEADVLAANQVLKTAGFKPQAHVRSVNLFQFIEGRRVRVEQPSAAGKFSPNALLRPLYQCTLLPDVATVGGPGEAAYWMQLRGSFERAGLVMPVLVPRHGGLVLPAALARLRADWDLTEQETVRSEPNLTRLLVGKDLPKQWIDHRAELLAWIEKSTQLLSSVDPSLEATARGSGARIAKEMEKLGLRLHRSVKSRNPELIKAIGQWFHVVSPGGAPQERTLNYFELAAAWNPEDMHDLSGKILADIRASLILDLQPEFHLIEQDELPSNGIPA